VLDIKVLIVRAFLLTVVQHHDVCSGQVDTQATSTCGQQEHKLFGPWAVHKSSSCSTCRLSEARVQM
jgi:hypothetical protein